MEETSANASLFSWCGGASTTMVVTTVLGSPPPTIGIVAATPLGVVYTLDYIVDVSACTGIALGQ